jgi:hypothetical protein
MMDHQEQWGKNMMYVVNGSQFTMDEIQKRRRTKSRADVMIFMMMMTVFRRGDSNLNTGKADSEFRQQS